jgi:hypothetical protein
MHECRTCLCATAGRHFGGSASVFNSKAESDSNQALSVRVGGRRWLYVTFFWGTVERSFQSLRHKQLVGPIAFYRGKPV